MSDDANTTTSPRASRFKEHTNTNGSIRPPPDELWKDLGIEELLEQFSEENAAPPVLHMPSAASNGPETPRIGDGFATTLTSSSEIRAPGTHGSSSITVSSRAVDATSGETSATTPTFPPTPAPAASEGTFGRFRSAFASVFGGVLGKRKAGNVDSEKDKEKKILDERKKAADAAYQEAKDLGLLPTPKIFVRPHLAGKPHHCAADADAAAPLSRTPRPCPTPNRKDLVKQRKLSKRVSNLEFKLAAARKELQSVLHGENLPPLPTLAPPLPPTPTASHSEHDVDIAGLNSDPIASGASAAGAPSPLLSPALAPDQQSLKVAKKRKATSIDEEAHKPTPIDSDGDIDMQQQPSTSEPEAKSERKTKRVKPSASRKNLKRQPSRLRKKSSKSSVMSDEIFTIVPDGVTVPPIPVIPKGVKGKKVNVGADGYGGLEHEMF